VDGQPQGGDHIQILGGLQNGLQPFLRALEQGVLQEQVPAGVPGQAQLGQGQHPHALSIRFPHQGKDLLRIVPAVPHADLGGPRRHFDKTVAH
jgi:hypothetical protein